MKTLSTAMEVKNAHGDAVKTGIDRGLEDIRNRQFRKLNQQSIREILAGFKKEHKKEKKRP